MANQYRLLEELGSKCHLLHCNPADKSTDHPTITGGSFGVVYKAIELATGDVVAIKLVSLQASMQNQSSSDIDLD